MQQLFLWKKPRDSPALSRILVVDGQQKAWQESGDMAHSSPRLRSKQQVWGIDIFKMFAILTM